jgi:Dipeptidyl peptidase IV (DPP IV) N-terminal region
VREFCWKSIMSPSRAHIISCFVTLDSVKSKIYMRCIISGWKHCSSDFLRVLLTPAQYFIREFYFTGVTWVSQTEISVVWMNRAQNYSLVSICKNPLWMCQEVSRNMKNANWHVGF